MIIEGLCMICFSTANVIISSMPSMSFSNSNFIIDTISLLSKAMKFFPADVWALAIGNIIFWIGLHLIVGFIKFILGFIPTMDGG